MNYYELKNQIKSHNPGSYYFTKDTLKFFGVRESESRVLKAVVTIKQLGKNHLCYILSERQHNAPAGVPQRFYSYFDTSTFERVFPD